MRQLQPIIAQIPYNGVRARPLFSDVCCPHCPTRPLPPSLQIPGNHESANNFTHYKTRFASVAEVAGAHSGSGTNMYYSVVDGLTHFLFWVRTPLRPWRCVPARRNPSAPPAAGHGGVLGAATRLPDIHGELAQG